MYEHRYKEPCFDNRSQSELFPRYLLIEFGNAEAEQLASDEDVLEISKRIASKNRIAYDSLSK